MAGVSLSLSLGGLGAMVVVMFGWSYQTIALLACLGVIWFLHREDTKAAPETKKVAAPLPKPPPPPPEVSEKKRRRMRLVKRLCYPMKIRDLQSDAEVAVQNIQPNGDPVPIENSYFKGQALVKMRTPNAEYTNPAVERFFMEEMPRLQFELQVQGVLKRVPPGMMFMGVEVKEPLGLGMFTKNVAKAILRIMKGYVPGLHSSFGEDPDVPEVPHISMPLQAVMHHIVETPPGETPPQFDGSKFPDTNIDRKTMTWKLGSTMSLAFSSPNLDFLNYKIVSIPGGVVGDQDLSKFCRQPMSLFAYYLSENHDPNHHLTAEKNYCFCFELEHTGEEVRWEEEWVEDPNAPEIDEDGDDGLIGLGVLRAEDAEVVITGWIEQPSEGPLFVVQVSAAVSGIWSVIRSYDDFETLDRQHERAYRHVTGHKRPALATPLPKKSNALTVDAGNNNALERFLQALIGVGTEGHGELEAILEAFLVSGTPTSDCMYIGATVDMACPFRHSHTFMPYDRIPTQTQQAPEKKWKAVLHTIKHHPKNLNKIRKERKQNKAEKKGEKVNETSGDGELQGGANLVGERTRTTGTIGERPPSMSLPTRASSSPAEAMSIPGAAGSQLTRDRNDSTERTPSVGSPPQDSEAEAVKAMAAAKAVSTEDDKPERRRRRKHKLRSESESRAAGEGSSRRRLESKVSYDDLYRGDRSVD